MSGFLYIATNSSMPGLVKIGRTATSPTQRMSELHTTGVPTPFELEFVAKVPDAVQAEKRVHATLNLHRISKGREFFRVSVTDAARRVLEVIGPHEIDWKYTRQRQAIEALEGEYKKELVRKWDMQQRVVFNFKEEEKEIIWKIE